MPEIHVLASGSDGNCSVIVNDDQALMVDAGLNCKNLIHLMDVEGVDPHMIKGLVLTHEHSDHISGADVFCRKFDVPVYTTFGTYEGFNHKDLDFHPISRGDSFELCGMNVTSIPTSHDAAEPTAYTVLVDGKRVSIITDTGVLTEPCQKALRDSDVAILEANYDEQMLRNGDYPYSLKQRILSDKGHLCNTDTGRWVADTATSRQRKLFLAHLSRNNNTPDIARDTVSKLSGIPRVKIDCLEFRGHTRSIRL